MPMTTDTTENGAKPVPIQEEVNELRRDEHALGERTARLSRASNLNLILSTAAIVIGVSALVVALVTGSSRSDNSAPAAAQAPVAAHAGGAKPAAVPAAAAAGIIDVKLGEMFVRPNAQTVRAGSVTFRVANTGTLTHEMIVERAPVTLDPSGKANEGHSSGEVAELQPGANGKVTLKLKPGTYQLFCNVPGHYAAGQRTDLTVTKG